MRTAAEAGPLAHINIANVSKLTTNWSLLSLSTLALRISCEKRQPHFTVVNNDARAERQDGIEI
jgi:hypothetical protein